MGNNISYVPNRQVHNMYSQMGTQMVPYQPNHHDPRSIASVNLPLYPGSIAVPIPPPPPPTNPSSQHSVGFVPINSSIGEVGQQFGGKNGYFA